MITLNIKRRKRKINAKDPTRTITLRKQYSADASRRLRKLKRDIKNIIVGFDVFGLSNTPRIFNEIKMHAIYSRSFAYETDAVKIEKFMDWLQEQHNQGLLEVVASPIGTIEPWSNTYVRSAYQKGLAQADINIVAKGFESFVSPGFYSVRNANAMASLFTRNYLNLKGVTDMMDLNMSRVLSQGLAEGVSANEMARRMNSIIEKSGGTFPKNHPKGISGIERSRLIARTEVTNAYNQAQINEYAELENLIQEKVYAQWWTALDERVRSWHSVRHGEIFEQSVAEQLIGEPNCRCTLLEYVKSVDGEKKDLSIQEIENKEKQIGRNE